jgi:hypothetical protein
MRVGINIGSCWHDKDEANKIAKSWLTDYNIKATFNDGDDYYSTWSIEGYFENVKKFLLEVYILDMGGEDCLDKEIDEDVLRIIKMD